MMTDYDLIVNHNINNTVSSSELFNPEEETMQWSIPTNLILKYYVIFEFILL